MRIVPKTSRRQRAVKGAISRRFPPNKSQFNAAAACGEEMPWTGPLAVRLIRPRGASFHF
jgi:hypothetical protein